MCLWYLFQINVRYESVTGRGITCLYAGIYVAEVSVTGQDYSITCLNAGIYIAEVSVTDRFFSIMCLQTNMLIACLWLSTVLP